MKSPFSTYSTLEDAGIYSIGDKRKKDNRERGETMR
jgi:hypothetical protein